MPPFYSGGEKAIRGPSFNAAQRSSLVVRSKYLFHHSLTIIINQSQLKKGITILDPVMVLGDWKDNIQNRVRERKRRERRGRRQRRRKRRERKMRGRRGGRLEKQRRGRGRRREKSKRGLPRADPWPMHGDNKTSRELWALCSAVARRFLIRVAKGLAKSISVC